MPLKILRGSFDLLFDFFQDLERGQEDLSLTRCEFGKGLPSDMHFVRGDGYGDDINGIYGEGRLVDHYDSPRKNF
jgi:hypothetical protein